MRNPTPTRVSAALRRLARASGPFDAGRYFRGDHGLRFYNVSTANMRSLVRAIYIANRAEWTGDAAIRFADALMRDPLRNRTVLCSETARPAHEHSSRGNETPAEPGA